MISDRFQQDLYRLGRVLLNRMAPVQILLCKALNLRFPPGFCFLQQP